MLTESRKMFPPTSKKRATNLPTPFSVQIPHQINVLLMQFSKSSTQIIIIINGLTYSASFSVDVSLQLTQPLQHLVFVQQVFKITEFIFSVSQSLRERIIICLVKPKDRTTQKRNVAVAIRA